MLPVSKYHGCGNDFIILREEDAAEYDLKTLIPAVCDRHTGLGADGFILVRTCPLTMIFYNCDGSPRPYVRQRYPLLCKILSGRGLVDGECLAVETLAGPKMVTVASRDPFLAQVAMGKSRLFAGVDRRGTFRSGIGFSGAGRREKILVDSFFMSTVHTVWFVKDRRTPKPSGSRV